VSAAALLAVLLILALMIPVIMALWFAPALVLLRDQPATAALRQSFRACLKNLVPFVLYAFILFVLALLAFIPAGLGLLVLGPVVFGSTYAAYRDLFLPS
jgi:uncharacterized membrane protein